MHLHSDGTSQVDGQGGSQTPAAARATMLLAPQVP